MGLGELILMAAGLSMDAAALSMADGLQMRGSRRRTLWAIPLAFGFFQALMPLIGYAATFFIDEWITPYTDAVVFIVFLCLGFRMLTGAHGEKETPPVTFSAVVGQAFATSLDALATGIGLRVADADIFFSVAVIGAVTFLLCLGAIYIGRKTGNRFGAAAQILGGIILLGLAVKSLIALIGQ